MKSLYSTMDSLQSCGSAFLEVGIPDGQFRLGQVFAIRVGVDKGLQAQAPDS